MPPKGWAVAQLRLLSRITRKFNFGLLVKNLHFDIKFQQHMWPSIFGLLNQSKISDTNNSCIAILHRSNPSPMLWYARVV